MLAFLPSCSIDTSFMFALSLTLLSYNNKVCFLSNVSTSYQIKTSRQLSSHYPTNIMLYSSSLLRIYTISQVIVVNNVTWRSPHSPNFWLAEIENNVRSRGEIVSVLHFDWLIKGLVSERNMCMTETHITLHDELSRRMNNMNTIEHLRAYI